MLARTHTYIIYINFYISVNPNPEDQKSRSKPLNVIKNI